MSGFLLETLAGSSWRRDGRTYWTREGAEREARRVLRRGKAVEVRILPVEVGSEAVDTFSKQGGRADD